MTDQHVLDVLNDVRAAIEAGPYARVREVGAFLSAAGTKEHDTVLGILADEERCVAELASLLAELGGTPTFASPDALSGRLHYLDMRCILKLIRDTKARLANACDAALGLVGDSAESYQLISQVASLHRDHILQIEKLS